MWFPSRLYSQNFEDLYLNRLFCDVDNGFYIDAGAWHPSIDSVTRIFYEQGWSGINIEPLKEAYDLLIKHRPRDFNLNLAVSEKRSAGKERFCVFGDEPLLMGQHYLDKHANTEDINIISKSMAMSSRLVLCSNLREVFERYASHKEIHFLKLDVEGAEFQALKGLHLETLPQHLFPLVILIEVTLPDTRLSAPHRSECRNYLEANSYKHLFFDGLNDYYCLKSSYNIFSSRMLPPNVFDRPLIHCYALFDKLHDTSNAKRLNGELQERLSNLQNDHEINYNKLHQAIVRRDELWHEKEESRQHVKQLQNALELIRNEMQEVVIERDALAREGKKVQHQVTVLSQQLEARGEELQQFWDENNSQFKQHQDFQQQVAELRQQVAELRQQLEAKAGELQKVVGERDARAKEKGEAQQTVEKLAQQLKTAHTVTKNTREEAELTLRQLHQVQEELKQAFLADQSMQEQIKSFEVDLKYAQTELKNLGIKHDAQAQQKEKAQQQVIRLNQHLEAKEERLQKLAAKRDALAKESQETRKQLALLKKQMEAKENELQKVTRALHARNQEQAVAQQQKEVLSKELSATQNKLTAKTAELQDMEDEFHKLRLRHLRHRS